MGNKVLLTKTILEGLVNLVRAIKCRLVCCKSSCNTVDETDREEKSIKIKYQTEL